METTIGEKERLIEKLREQKHTSDIEHQEEIEQLQKTLQETRLKLEQKEKDYYEGQVNLSSSKILSFLFINTLQFILIADLFRSTKVISKFRVFNEILVLIFKPSVSDYANRES